MNTIKPTENHQNNRFLQEVVDVSIILLLSITVLNAYKNYWTAVHIAQENMFAIHFDMFNNYFSFAFLFFMVVAPNFVEYMCDKKIPYRHTDKKQKHAKLIRLLKIIAVTVFVVLIAAIFSDKYSRVEFYDNGSIIEYNKDNQIVNEYNETDIDFIEIRTNHDLGRPINYWTEAIFRLQNKSFLLREKNYIAPDNYEINYATARSLYGLKIIKGLFSDKIKINTENIDTLLQVEWTNYTQQQAKELCEIFEVDYDKMILWLKEEWDIVIKE